MQNKKLYVQKQGRFTPSTLRDRQIQQRLIDIQTFRNEEIFQKVEEKLRLSRIVSENFENLQQLMKEVQKLKINCENYDYVPNFEHPFVFQDRQLINFLKHTIKDIFRETSQTFLKNTNEEWIKQFEKLKRFIKQMKIQIKQDLSQFTELSYPLSEIYNFHKENNQELLLKKISALTEIAFSNKFKILQLTHQIQNIQKSSSETIAHKLTKRLNDQLQRLQSKTAKDKKKKDQILMIQKKVEECMQNFFGTLNTLSYITNKNQESFNKELSSVKFQFEPNCLLTIKKQPCLQNIQAKICDPKNLAIPQVLTFSSACLHPQLAQNMPTFQNRQSLQQKHLFDWLYKIDKDNYLLDKDNNYIVGQNGSPIHLSLTQIDLIRSSGLIEFVEDSN